MKLTTTATTPAQMRDEIANYLAAQAENFASRKHATGSKLRLSQLEAIRNALMAIAEDVKGIGFES